jgi:hypothetical protein
MLNPLLGGKRFAHLRRLQDDRAVAAILGFKKGRICREDAFVRMMSRADRQKARSWMAASERDLHAALPVRFMADWDCLSASPPVRRSTPVIDIKRKWKWAAISQAYKRLQRWLARSAPQFGVQQTFERYLCWHNPLSPQNWLNDAPP